MKLWLLSAIEQNGYDCFDGFVIRAETEALARDLAQRSGGDETKAPAERIGHSLPNRSRAYWTDVEKSSCVELNADGPAKVLLGSFNAG